MSDTTINRYIGQGDDAAEAAWAAVPPDPSTAVTIPENAVLFVNTEDPANPILKYWDGAAFVEFPSSGGTGNVSAAGTLTDHAIVLGDGSTDVTVVASLGTSTQVLHGAAAGDPTWGAVNQATDVTGTLAVGNGGTGATTLTAHGVVIGNGSSAVAITSAGTTGQVLTSNGASADPTFQAASGGGLSLLEQHAASSSASLNFTTGITSAYDDYMFELINLVPASDANLYMLVSFDGGANWEASNYKFGTRWVNMNNTAGTNASNGTTQFTVWGTLEATSGAGFSGSIKMHNPLGAQRFKFFPYDGGADQDDGSQYAVQGTLIYSSTSAINAIQFKMAGGVNIASGTVRLYGLAK